MVKGLSKTGLKSLKLASASGGLECAAYGATGSDSLDELLENVAWGAAFGAALPFGLYYGIKGVKYAARPVTKKATRYLGKRKLANPANKVVVGKHRDTGDVFIKTAMKDSGLSKKNKTLDGRTFPSFAVDSTVTGNSNIPSPQHVRFSVFQGLNENIIPQNMSTVNPAFKRSFVETLADDNKRRTMRNCCRPVCHRQRITI